MSKFLRNSLHIAALALPIVALSTQNASAQDRRDFAVVNSNRQTITQFYVSSTNRTTWGPDILSGVLPSGTSTTVFFSGHSNRCMYDVMAVYRDRTYDMSRINVCQTLSIDFNGDGGDYAP